MNVEVRTVEMWDVIMTVDISKRSMQGETVVYPGGPMACSPPPQKKGENLDRQMRFCRFFFSIAKIKLTYFPPLGKNTEPTDGNDFLSLRSRSFFLGHRAIVLGNSQLGYVQTYTFSKRSVFEMMRFGVSTRIVHVYVNPETPFKRAWLILGNVPPPDNHGLCVLHVCWQRRKPSSSNRTF